jgi:hypothetical protein
VLSSLSKSRAFRNLAPTLALLLLIATWTALYMHVPAIRAFGDERVAQAYAALPQRLQHGAALIWHFFLPDFVLQKARRCALVITS